METLYTLDISEKLGSDEYIPAVDDVTRMVVIQIIVQLMFYLNDPSENEFFTETFFATLLYIVLGISVYWLVVKKLITIR
jgi:heme/copper-type cytochrome/quinol oxidase subunit 4